MTALGPGTELADYGGYYRSSGSYRVCTPRTLDELAACVRDAHASGTPLRVRGNGHSMHGGAVPRDGELLLLTRELCGFRIDDGRTVTVGAGAAVWDVHAALAPLGYELLVYNDGNAAAASVGGYVAAGGFGGTSWREGGFWETVESLELVAGDGSATTLRPADEAFRWIFGAMGQLGIVGEVTLRIRRIGDDAHANGAANAAGRIAASAHDWEKIVWFSAYVPRRGWRAAQGELIALGARHAGAFEPRPPYAYSIPFGRFNPPLIHPLQESLVAIGIWGTPRHSGGFDVAALRALDAEFTAWLGDHPEYRRYAQSELLFEDFDFERHFGAQVFAQFAAWKRALDPGGILGRGLFAP